MASVKKRLDEVYKKAKIIPYDFNSKFILMSDCHRGQGNAADNFLPNQTLFFGALEYYYQNGYTYIELGDGDELWENRKIKPIIDIHSDAFWMLSNFYRENRFYMLYGNHDIVKARSSFSKNYCEKYYYECEQCHLPLFPKIEMYEGLILEDIRSKQRIFLVHGHQGDLLNDTLWPLARFLVRYVWHGLELIGFLDPTGAGRPRKQKEKVEKKLSAYAKSRGEILVAGHTHRPSFQKPGQSLYFNDGSCVHPSCITGIEIVNGYISLIKWSIRSKADRTLYVGKEYLEEPVRISDYYKYLL